MSRSKEILLLLLICGGLFFTNLGVPGLWDEDEPRNATCAREMYQRGDWIVPTFNGQLRTAKPVLLYWLIMSAYAVFGINEFSARLWSALLGTGTVLLTASLGARLYSRRVGFWSAIFLASGLMFVVASRACTPDACLVFCATATLVQGGLLWATPNGNSPFIKSNSLWPQIGIFLTMGVGVLAKGPVAVVLPGGILLAYLYLLKIQNDGLSSGGITLRGATQSLTAWKTHASVWKAIHPLLAAGVILAVALPWYLAVAIRTEGAWLQQFLGAENVGRFLKPMEGHRGPIVYYLPAILIGFYPGSVFLPYALWNLTQRLRRNFSSADLFLACWGGIWVGFFSLAGTKLPSYVTPAYPALAILTARTFVEWLEKPSLIPGILTRIAFAVPIVVGLGVLIAVPSLAQHYLPGETQLLWVGVIPLLCGVFAWRNGTQHRLESYARWFACGGIGFSLALFGMAVVEVDQHQSSAPLIGLIKTQHPRKFRLGTFRFSPPSLVYYAGQVLTELRSPEEVRRHLSSPESPGYLIVREADLPLIQPVIPVDCQVIGQRR
ncbi:MAG: glycosyltransferase family 39 protein, partial [Planctomycetales bacterium]